MRDRQSQLEDNVSCSESMFYNHLFGEEFGIVKYRLGSDSAPIVNLKDRIRIVYPNNSIEVKY